MLEFTSNVIYSWALNCGGNCLFDQQRDRQPYKWRKKMPNCTTAISETKASWFDIIPFVILFSFSSLIRSQVRFFFCVWFRSKGKVLSLYIIIPNFSRKIYLKKNDHFCNACLIEIQSAMHVWINFWYLSYSIGQQFFCIIIVAKYVLKSVIVMPFFQLETEREKARAPIDSPA